jgi:predicted  nucleic acid-binding Zn-ribbon protein
MDTTLPSEMLGVAEAVDAPRPSALAAAQAADSTLAINSIDARELVAGLFERWERALEQRIQAEQRLRFEAELERRLRQVRDLRQELENTRNATAAQLAEREQEVMALRNRLHEQEAAPKRRGLFRR